MSLRKFIVLRPASLDLLISFKLRFIVSPLCTCALQLSTEQGLERSSSQHLCNFQTFGLSCWLDERMYALMWHNTLVPPTATSRQTLPVHAHVHRKQKTTGTINHARCNRQRLPERALIAVCVCVSHRAGCHRCWHAGGCRPLHVGALRLPAR